MRSEFSTDDLHYKFAIYIYIIARPACMAAWYSRKALLFRLSAAGAAGFPFTISAPAPSCNKKMRVRITNLIRTTAVEAASAAAAAAVSNSINSIMIWTVSLMYRVAGVVCITVAAVVA